MPLPTAAVLGAFGLVIGSFLNVCIHRLPKRESVVWPASHCPACGRALAWHENIPVVSYLALRGACRTCHARISPVYPVVELATAAIFVVVGAGIGSVPLVVSRLIFACALIVLFAIDWQHQILPNEVTLPGIVAGFAFSLFLPPGWLSSLIGIVAGGGVLLLIERAYYCVRREEGLGMGDVKMLAMVGAFLGWQLMLLTLVLSSLLGSLVGVALVIRRRGNLKHALPFGTFLAAGALVASLVGDAIVEWYAGFFG
jgi:leader peptidase (prepilin peptidase) / N-methyltransferase